MKRFFLLVLFLSVLPTSSRAVDALDPCKVIAEEIIPLRIPDFDQAALWKKLSGVDGIDRPRAALPVLDGGQIIIGDSVRYDEKTGLGKPQIQILRTDKSGKIVVEKWLGQNNLETVTDALLLKNRIVILSHLNNDDVSLAFLDGAGQLKSQKIINHPKLYLNPASFTTVDKGNQFVIAAEGTSRTNKNDHYTVLIWTDATSKILFTKEYLPGIQNKPSFISRVDNDGLIVTGQVAAGSEDAGWVMRLDNKGNILFQRPFARGAGSILRRAIPSYDDSIIAVGAALPSGKGSKAGWIIKVDKNGDAVWQKFITGTYHYGGVDVIDMNDGRINVLMAATPYDSGGREFARVLTLSNDGVLIGDESFLEGSNAIPMRIINQTGKRTLLGMAETGFAKEKFTDERKYITYDTWVLGMLALPEYQSTCAAQADNKLLDDRP